MKKRANLITRVALAATIFVTALAGVTPMTAKAVEKSSNFTVSGNATVEVNGDYTIKYNYDDTKMDFTPPTITATDSIPTTEIPDPVIKSGLDPSKDYSVSGWFTAATGGTKVTKVSDVATSANHNPTIYAQLTETFKAPAKPTMSVNGTTVADGDKIELSAASAAVVLSGSEQWAKYKWTTDGTNPTAATTNETNTIILSSTATNSEHTIKAIASNGDATSSIATITVVLNYVPATTKFSATASATTYDKNATSKSAIKITGAGTNSKIYAVTSGSNVNIATINSDGTATLETSYLDGLTSGVYEFKAWNTTSPTPETDTINITITGTNVTGTLAEIESVKWRSNYNGANLGSISSMGKTYTDDPRTAVYEVGGEIEFTNGTPFADIISELKKSTQVDIDLNKESEVHHGSVTWLTASKKSSTLPYNNTEADSDQMNTYDIDSKKEDSFIVYSDPIEIWSDEDKYHIDSAGTKNIRLKLKVKILAEGETANTSTSTGSSAPTNLTFNPGDGTYVTPNSIIRFSATASSGTVKYNVTSGNITPTTSNGADGANGVTIPGSVPAGDYKMNVNAYTNSTNTTTKSATFKVVTNNKYNVTYDNGVLTCDGDFGNFKGLWITNAAGQYEFVPAANYAVASGSTVVTLSPTYLMTQTGAKSVRMVYTDGYAEGNFTLTAGSSTVPTNITDPTAGNTSGSTQGGGRSGVGTDDRSELVIMFVLLGMLIAGFVVSVYYKNEKLRRNRYMD